MKSEFDASISADDWCGLFGIGRNELSARSERLIASTLSNYRRLKPAERETHILRVLKRLGEQGVVRNTQENIEAFESGWDENFRLCRERGVSAMTLRPKYVKAHACVRFKGDYIAPENPYLANDLLEIAAGHYFEKYLNDASSIYEFGCGTGRFLFELSELFPQKKLVGLDWTYSSQKLLELIAQSGRNVTGIRFDMLEPASAVRMDPGAAVVTIGAMEQLGSRFEPFLKHLLENSPSIAVHLEPIDDFYSQDTLCDYMAVVYHRQRKYLSGFVSALEALRNQGRIEILESRRLFFGDPFHESSSCIVWRPIETD